MPPFTLPKLAGLTLPRLGTLGTAPPKEPRKEKGPYLQSGTLTGKEVVGLAKAGGAKPTDIETEPPAGWFGPVEKLFQGLDFLGNEVRHLAFDWTHNDDELARLPKNFAGRPILSGGDIVGKLGVENSVAKAILGFGLEIGT